MPPKKVINIQAAIFVCILVGSFGTTSFSGYTNIASYSFVACSVLLFLVQVIFFDFCRHSSGEIKTIDLFPGLVLALWVYGAIRGMALGNDPESVVRNFFGMTVYVMYYIIGLSNIKNQLLIRVVLVAGMITMSIMYLVFVFDKVFSPYVYGKEYFSLITTRSYYSDTVSLLAGVLVTHVVLQSYKPSHSRVLLIALLAFAYLQITLSKSTLFSYLLVILPFVFIAYVKKFLKPKVYVLILLSVMAALPAFVEFDYASAYFQSNNANSSKLTAEKLSVKVRSEQNAAILQDLSLMGSGLGAKLSSGYSRDERGYGFENTYLNIAHKFGIFSIVVFLFYFYTLYKICCKFFKRNMIYAAVSLTFISGLFLGAGNPTLFAPSFVFLHCVILNILRDSNDKNIF